jgi:hypothetical protein
MTLPLLQKSRHKCNRMKNGQIEDKATKRNGKKEEMKQAR